ncbi:hypothetical protein [Pelotalea chapellei]|uniref:Tetratricopeptide repeat protein n=1 Tax=Pelotalea chapellei TaxID=44671 RepID=A0ABS5U858_9BACT|nr:hypothetical protein [Pelotalea chapellei]MBT1071847.1 hypothetical protein [Pelotalea chapellei]
MHWQSPVNKPENGQRERFSSPLAVLGIFCSFLAVLALLFPEQGLLSILDQGDDPATSRYREVLLRVRPNDTDLRLKVASSHQSSGNPHQALETLSLLPSRLTAEQQQRAVELRYQALVGMFAQARPNGTEWQRLRPQVATAARELAGPSPPAWRLNAFAADARKAGDLETSREYLRKAESLTVAEKQPPKPLDPVADAIARGEYRAAAALCFQDMGKAVTLNRRRAMFMRGVRILQAGNLPLEALDAGERHLNGLSGDKTTLIFLTRVGLAANQPARAQSIIRKALGMDVDTSGAGPS